MLKVLDLFSGIGGFSLGLERTGGFKTVAFCEIEEYPRRILAKHWPDVPIYEDVKELTHERLEADGLGRIDLICGGYPCQPFSHAGERRGAEDDRYLWPEVKRLMATVRPAWGVFENVAGHVSMGLDEVLSDLEAEGYTGFPVVVPACAVNASHRRDRVWILAHRSELQCDGGGEYSEQSKRQVSQFRDNGCEEFMADAGCVNKQGHSIQTPERKSRKGAEGGTKQSNRINLGLGQEDYKRSRANSEHGARWLTEPDVGRVAHGVPKRVDRLKGLGNAVVPQIPEIIGNAILEAET